MSYDPRQPLYIDNVLVYDVTSDWVAPFPGQLITTI